MSGRAVTLFSLLTVAVARPAGAWPGDHPDWVVPSAHAAAVLAGQRIALSVLWPDAFDPTTVGANASRFADGWSSWPAYDGALPAFESDGDPWPLNLVGHGLMGSELYLRYRETHHSPWVALGAAAGWTLVWEYGLEAWHKHPSAVDLVWTPAGGALLGELRFRAVERLRAQPSALWPRALLYVVDPFGQLERDLLGLPD